MAECSICAAPPFSYLKGAIKLYWFMFFMALFVLITGCSPRWSPSDHEALKLVKEYYLYYHEGENVEAEILKRDEFVDSCKCYPVQFQLTGSSSTTGTKTFYFIKNNSGGIEIKRYAHAAIHAINTVQPEDTR